MSTAPRRRAPEFAEVEIENFLLCLHRVSNALADSNILAKYSIGISEWAVLNTLDGGKEFNLQQIVRQAGVSRQRIRMILRELETKRLVTVSQVTKGDKRQRIVTGTVRGADMRQSILADLRELANSIANQVPTIERTKLLQRFVLASRVADRVTRSLRSAQKKSGQFWAKDVRT